MMYRRLPTPRSRPSLTAGTFFLACCVLVVLPLFLLPKSVEGFFSSTKTFATRPTTAISIGNDQDYQPTCQRKNSAAASLSWFGRGREKDRNASAGLWSRRKRQAKNPTPSQLRHFPKGVLERFGSIQLPKQRRLMLFALCFFAATLSTFLFTSAPVQATTTSSVGLLLQAVPDLPYLAVTGNKISAAVEVVATAAVTSSGVTGNKISAAIEVVASAAKSSGVVVPSLSLRMIKILAATGSIWVAAAVVRVVSLVRHSEQPGEKVSKKNHVVSAEREVTTPDNRLLTEITDDVVTEAEISAAQQDIGIILEELGTRDSKLNQARALLNQISDSVDESSVAVASVSNSGSSRQKATIKSDLTNSIFVNKLKSGTKQDRDDATRRKVDEITTQVEEAQRKTRNIGIERQEITVQLQADITKMEEKDKFEPVPPSPPSVDEMEFAGWLQADDEPPPPVLREADLFFASNAAKEKEAKAKAEYLQAREEAAARVVAGAAELSSIVSSEKVKAEQEQRLAEVARLKEEARLKAEAEQRIQAEKVKAEREQRLAEAARLKEEARLKAKVEHERQSARQKAEADKKKAAEEERVKAEKDKLRLVEGERIKKAEAEKAKAERERCLAEAARLQAKADQAKAADEARLKATAVQKAAEIKYGELEESEEDANRTSTAVEPFFCTEQIVSLSTDLDISPPTASGMPQPTFLQRLGLRPIKNLATPLGKNFTNYPPYVGYKMEPIPKKSVPTVEDVNRKGGNNAVAAPSTRRNAK